MSNIPYGYHDTPFHGQHLPSSQTIDDTPSTISASSNPSKTDHNWVFFPDGIPGFSFRLTANIQSRKAAVSNITFRVSNQGGIFQVEDRLPAARQQLEKVTEGTAPVSSILGSAEWIAGQASLLKPPSDDFNLAMSSRWRLAPCRMILTEGIDTQGNQHGTEEVSGFTLIGSSPTWAIADRDAEEKHPESKLRVSTAKLALKGDAKSVRVFVFAPLRFIIDQTGLFGGLFSTVSDFRAATYRYKDGDDGFGGVLITPTRPNHPAERLPGYSLTIDTQEALVECLRFGGGRRHAKLESCNMKVYGEDWRGVAETQGFAVIYGGDKAELCPIEMTEYLGGIVQTMFRELGWTNERRRIYTSVRDFASI